MRRAVVLVCAALGLGAVLNAQGPGERRTPPRRDFTIETLVADAAIIPPEFGADALIRISSLPRVDAAWRRELLEDAYMRAYAAPEQYRRATTRQLPSDSRQGAQAFAYATAPTRVTLQVRAVELMAFVDPLRARDLFEWIDLNLAPGTCADPLVPAVDEYYAALGQIARTRHAIDAGDALNFFVLYLWRAHLPSEMPAVARAIQRYPRGMLLGTYLEGVFRQILLDSSADAAGFSSAAPDVVAKLTDLQIADTELGILGSNVMDALRTYLLAQLRAPRCADNDTAMLVPAAFNAAVRRAKAEFDVRPLDAADARLPSLLGTAKIDLYWQTADARRLQDAFMRLRGPGATAVPLRIRRTPEWRNQAERLLTDVDQWSGKSEPAVRDYFYQKSLLYTWLLDLMPASSVRSHVLRSFVEFMRRSETDVGQRMLWFAFVNRLLEMTHGPYRSEVLAAMEESHQPTLWVYARIERQIPERRPDR
jgi:hypothetical protein